MSFYELLHKVTGLLESEGRISYRAIKREFDIDDDLLEDLKRELVEVKQIARDVDGDILELVSVAGKVGNSKPSPEVLQGSGRPATEAPAQIATPSEPVEGSGWQASKDAGENHAEGKPVKRTLLIWLGAACILIGALLPWVTVRMEVAGLGPRSSSATGLDLNQGLLSIAVSLFSGLVAFVTARRSIQAKVVAIAIIVTGIVVIGVTLDVIDGISTSDMGLRGFGGRTLMSVRQTPKPGVFVTLIGGALLSVGGLIALIRARKQ